MPAEVISLLSSPLAAVIPALKESIWNQKPPSRRLDYDATRFSDEDADPFACNITPLVSGRAVRGARSTLVNDKNRNDDFIDLVDDLTKENWQQAPEDLIHERPAKRVRYSPSNNGEETYQISGTSGAVSGTAIRNKARPSGARQAACHLDFTAPASRKKPMPTSYYELFSGSDPFDVPGSAGKEGPPRPRSPTGQIEQIDLFTSSPRQKVELTHKGLIWDPISSSAPESSARGRTGPRAQNSLTRTRSEAIILDDSDEDEKRPQSSSDMDEELPEVGSIDFTKGRPKISTAKPKATVGTARKPLVKPKAPIKKSVEERTREKERKAAAKEAEKAQKRREKEQAKEQKATAAALAEVNKIRTDKKVSTPEMIVDLPSTLDPTVRVQTEALLSSLNVEHQAWDSPVANVVKWRRKVDREFNEALGHYEPVRARVDDEAHAMVLLNAAVFVQLVLGDEDADLESHILSMKTHFPGHTVIYLIEGLTLWMRKNRNLRNRQFTSAVRGLGAADAAPSGNQGRRKPPKAPQEYIDEDFIEDALLGLQVLHGALIHHTGTAVETAQWVSVFTQHVSTIPYRRQREASNDAGAAFCMESGQVRAGDGPRDTYVRMLQEISRVTAPIAYGIASEFESVSALVRGLEAGGPLALEDCRKSANKDGAVSDRTVGQAVSRRVYKVFTGRDAASTDI